MGNLRFARSGRRVESLREKENPRQTPARAGRDGRRSAREVTQSVESKARD